MGFLKRARDMGKVLARVNDLRDRVNRVLAYFLKLSRRADKQSERTEATEGLLIRQGEELERLRKLHFTLERAYVDTDRKVMQLDKAANGFWRTAAGHVLRIRDMSTDHIERCLAGNFVKVPSTRDHMKMELGRREEEAYWRSKPMPGEEKKKMAYVGRIDGTPIYVSNDTDFLEVVNIGNFLRSNEQ